MIWAGQASVLDSGTTSSTAYTAYQWYLNGILVPGASNSTLSLYNARPNVSGSYIVVVSNYVGAVTNYAAEVSFNVPLQLDPASKIVSTQFQCAVWGPSGQRFIVQVSRNFVNWIPFLTNQLPKNCFPFTDVHLNPPKGRFYRAIAQP
jgi:hypothetical protein